MTFAAPIDHSLQFLLLPSLRDTRDDAILTLMKGESVGIATRMENVGDDDNENHHHHRSAREDTVVSHAI